MPTSVIQEKGPSKTTPPFKEGIPLYHRSADKPLDPTTLTKKDTHENQVSSPPALLLGARATPDKRRAAVPAPVPHCSSGSLLLRLGGGGGGGAGGRGALFVVGVVIVWLFCVFIYLFFGGGGRSPHCARNSSYVLRIAGISQSEK